MNIIRGLNKDYWIYWIASAFANAGSNILQYILSLYVLEITGSSTLFASMLSIIIFPRLFLGPLGGVMADRVRKMKLMSWILFGEAAVLSLYMLMGQFMSINLALIYLLVIALECGEIFYNASTAAVLPELVPPEKLKDAISVSKVDDGIVVVLGPMIAALIYSNIDISFALGLVAALNLLAAILQKFIKLRFESRKELAVKQSLWMNFKEGLAFVKQDRFIRGLMVSVPLANAFFGSVFSVGVMYLFRQIYELDAYSYGLYCTVTSSMSLVIPLLALPVVKKYEPRRIYTVSTALIAIEIALIGLLAFLGVSQIMPVLLTVALITILDCMTIAEAMPMQLSTSIMIQTRVGKEMLGRVWSIVRVISVASISLGQMIFGILIEVTNPWLPILIGACFIGFGSFLFHRNTANSLKAETASGTSEEAAQ